jgi:hypothetical protein
MAFRAGELQLTPLTVEFDNYGACMSVSEELLCAFELLRPLDGQALRKEMTKAKRKRSAVFLIELDAVR